MTGAVIALRRSCRSVTEGHLKEVHGPSRAYDIGWRALAQSALRQLEDYGKHIRADCHGAFAVHLTLCGRASFPGPRECLHPAATTNTLFH
jgi:hypothetical protein